MQVNLLRDIVSLVGGQNAGRVVDILYNKKNVNEFLIAKNLNLTINQARNILYKLADEGLVSFVRKKDKKKGGWYIYFWTLNSGKSLIKFKEKLLKDIENLNNQVNSRKTKRFFYCKHCHIEYSEESALMYNYACPECGEILELKDNVEDISNLEKRMGKLQGLLREVEVEISSIRVVEDKVRARRVRAEDRKKAQKRLERKKEREKLTKKAKLRRKKKRHLKKKKSKRRK